MHDGHVQSSEISLMEMFEKQKDNEYLGKLDKKLAASVILQWPSQT